MGTLDEDRMGRVAYEAYADNRSWRTVSGERMPGWLDQAPSIRDGWIAAAAAVAALFPEMEDYS